MSNTNAVEIIDVLKANASVGYAGAVSGAVYLGFTVNEWAGIAAIAWVGIQMVGYFRKSFRDEKLFKAQLAAIEKAKESLDD